MIDILDYQGQHVHMIGIGGSSMSGLAEMLLKEGYTVTGSDNANSHAVERLRNMGIVISVGHKAENVHGAKLLLFSVAAVLVEFALAAGFVLLTEKEPEKRGVKIQGLFRSNFVLIGLPLTEALAEGKDIGPVALLIAVVVPLFNAMAVVTLEAFRGNRPPVGKILGNILINPLIIASALGLLFLLTPLRLGTVLESTVRQISGVANPFMLFLLGAFFRFDGLRRYWRDLLEVSIGRLVIIPGVFLTAAWLLGFLGVAFAGLIPMLGSATAVSSFTMVQQLGGDDELAGDIVVITSALCVVTLFFWSFLFKTLGAF